MKRQPTLAQYIIKTIFAFIAQLLVYITTCHEAMSFTINPEVLMDQDMVGSFRLFRTNYPDTLILSRFKDKKQGHI
jgi:hypothetical protein